MNYLSRFARWCVTNADGNTVLGESPNLPIIVAVLSAPIAFLAHGVIHTVATLVAYGAFFTWSWLEIFQPTTPLRRIIGIVSMIILLIVGGLLTR